MGILNGDKDRMSRGFIDTDALARAQGCLLGQLTGDALGSLVEFQTPEQIRREYPYGGRIRVSGDKSGTEIRVSVENTGPGVPEAEIFKVFDQFYRVEKSRSIEHGGSGLGLAIVKKIIELHRGKVKFESRQNGWTRITVSLPLQREKIPA